MAISNLVVFFRYSCMILELNIFVVLSPCRCHPLKETNHIVWWQAHVPPLILCRASCLARECPSPPPDRSTLPTLGTVRAESWHTRASRAERRAVCPGPPVRGKCVKWLTGKVPKLSDGDGPPCMRLGDIVTCTAGS